MESTNCKHWPYCYSTGVPGIPRHTINPEYRWLIRGRSRLCAESAHRLTIDKLTLLFLLPLMLALVPPLPCFPGEKTGIDERGLWVLIYRGGKRA